MRNIWTIAKREYTNYFNGPLAYLLILVIFIIIGSVFAYFVWSTTSNAFFAQPIDPTFASNWWPIILFFCIPALTMRLIADESRTGTLELLLTAPIRDWELVIGKWLGSFLFMLTAIIFTLIFPILINGMTDPGIDIVRTASSYFGLILIVASLLGIGVGISALFTNQFAAFFATFGAVFFIWVLIGIPDYVLPGGAKVFAYLNMSSHYQAFNTGNLNLVDIIYFVSVTALGLFIANIAIEYRRWQ